MSASRSQHGFVRRLLRTASVWLLLGLVFWFTYGLAVKRTQPAARADADSAVSAPVPQACADPFPAAGSESAAPDSGPAAAPTRFVNRTVHDLVIELGPSGGARHRAYVPAGASLDATLPAGAYPWRLRRGAAWCARERRFVRERQIEITTALELVVSSRLTLTIAPGPEPTGVTLSARDEPIVSVQSDTLPPQAAAMSSDGRLVLARDRDGHFRIDGAIDGEALRFIVDTGATEVAVSQAYAHRLGVTDGERFVSRTANGTVEGYAFTARVLRAGPYTFENLRVVVLPMLEGDALLGMRVLSAFDLSQSGDALAFMPRAH